MAWLEGKTEGGRTVLIEDDPYVNKGAEVLINGKAATIEHVSRYRDGGTTHIETSGDGGMHHIYYPSPFKVERAKKDNHELLPKLDGYDLR